MLPEIYKCTFAWMKIVIVFTCFFFFLLLLWEIEDRYSGDFTLLVCMKHTSLVLRPLRPKERPGTHFSAS